MNLRESMINYKHYEAFIFLNNGATAILILCLETISDNIQIFRCDASQGKTVL